MFFSREKEDMGLDGSLNLLDLSPSATIDDANQAYSYLHRMIDLFHKDNNASHGDRQEDLELLACAYEKAVSYLSDHDSRLLRDETSQASGTIAGAAPPTGGLYFKINFNNAENDHSSENDSISLPEPDNETVKNAVAIISRRLQEAESALEEAREAVEAATAAVNAANRRLDKTKQARMNAMIAAKSSKSRAMLMEIEAKRATEEAIAVAEKIRNRVKAAKQAAKEAKNEADKAQDQIRQIMSAEETAAAEAVCAEDRLEKVKQRLKTLTHAVVEARSQLRMFKDFGTQSQRLIEPTDSKDRETPFDDPPDLSPVSEYYMDTRQQILSDLMEIENSLNVRKQQARSARPDQSEMEGNVDQKIERRQHARLRYPSAQRPMFSFEGRTIPVLDLSQTGMGIEPDAEVGQSHLVRGAIVFNGLPTMNITGRVVRQDDRGVGLRLVTRIGNHILDQERMRLSA